MAAPSPPSSSSLLLASPDSLDPFSLQLLQQLTTVSITCLPIFSLEVHHHILRFCDAPKLAQTSRVSLAFLELSGPLLYRDISIVGWEAPFYLFCPKLVSSERLQARPVSEKRTLTSDLRLPSSQTCQPHVDRYTSLAQTKTLSIIANRTLSFPSRFYPDRLPSGQPLALETLRVQTSLEIPLPLHLLNPSTAILQAYPMVGTIAHVTRSSWGEELKWSRLRKNVFRDCTLRLRQNARREREEHSGSLLSLCTSEEQIRELEILFEATESAAQHDPYLFTNISYFRDFFNGGLHELMKGRRAVKQVVVRAASGREDGLRDGAN